MLLILAPSHDETAEAFSAWLDANAEPHARTQSLADLRLRVLVNSDGAPSVDLAIRSTGEPVDAILNRGFFWSSGGDEFEQSESLAAWWAALALFSGPVINRPSQAGLIPPSFEVNAQPAVERRIADRWPVLPRGLIAHRHDLATHAFLGRSPGEPSNAPFEQPELVTVFDPSALRHVLVVGRWMFDLTAPAAPIAVSSDDPVAAALGLIDRPPIFAHAVLSTSAGDQRIVQINYLPQLAYFGHFEAAVNDALLSELRP